MRGPVDQLPSWNDPPADPARLHPERLAEMASEDPSLRDQQQAVGELLMSGVRWCPVPESGREPAVPPERRTGYLSMA